MMRLVACLAFACVACSRGPLEAEEARALGGVLYFVSERAGEPRVFRVRPDGSEEAQVSDRVSYPYASSGSRIALIAADQLVIARPDGSEARVFEGVSRNPSFSPDGTRVLFESSREAFRELYVAGADGAPVRLTHNPEGNFDGAWSPDGKRIAFASSRFGELDLFVMNADGSDQKRLTSHRGDSIKPAWSPAGGSIAFISGRDGHDDLFLIRADGSELTRLTPSIDDVESFAWRPDGGAIAFAARAKDRKSKIRVVEIPPRGRAIAELSGPSDDDAGPTWSPDGRWLAFSASNDLSLMRADGTRRTRITHDPARAWRPRWFR